MATKKKDEEKAPKKPKEQKITELTKEQQAALPVYRDKWIAIARSTEPADRSAAEAAVKLAYECAGLKPVDKFVWFDSPKAAFKFFEENVEATTAADRRHQAWEIWASGCCFGNQETFLSFYDFFREECNLECCDKLAGLIDLAKVAGWWWPFEDMAVLTERPAEIRLDTNGRLHGVQAPAIKYRDGFAVYAWHSIRVKEEWIMHPEKITIEMVDQEQNAEIRRCLIDIMGYERFITLGNAKEVSRDKWGILYRRDLGRNADPVLVVKVKNSTPEPDGSIKDYWLRVHHECRPLLENNRLGDPQDLTPLNAIASTFGLVGKEYAGVKRET